MIHRVCLLAVCWSVMLGGPLSEPSPWLIESISNSISLPRPEPKPLIDQKFSTVQTKLQKVAEKSSAHRVRGVASYYCCHKDYPSGRYAAAGPKLRVGHWRGRTVLVNGLKVTLVDSCQCYEGTPRERIIDLYPGVFDDIDPLSKGITMVTVTWQP